MLGKKSGGGVGGGARLGVCFQRILKVKPLPRHTAMGVKCARATCLLGNIVNVANPDNLFTETSIKAVIAQLVARRSHNPKVVSSILTHRRALLVQVCIS